MSCHEASLIPLIRKVVFARRNSLFLDVEQLSGFDTYSETVDSSQGLRSADGGLNKVRLEIPSIYASCPLRGR